MNGNIIVALIVVFAALFTIRGIMKCVSGESDCCGCPDNKKCKNEKNPCGPV